MEDAETHSARRAVVRLLAITAVLLASPLVAVGDVPAPEFVKETFQWFEPVAAGQTIRVLNEHGAVYARFGGYGGDAELIATRQQLDPKRPPLEVDRAHDEDGLRVTVIDPDSDGGPRRGRIDLVVFVPKDVTLAVTTTTETIQVKKIKSDLVASSLSGDMRITGVAGSVQAKSARGDLEITLDSGVTGAAQTISTETGEIHVHIWEDAKHEAHIETSGEISTDFSMTIEHRRFAEPGKHAVAVINGGGPKLNLNSKRGRVRLLRLPRDFTPPTSGETRER